MSTMSASTAPAVTSTRRRRFAFAAAATVALVVAGSAAVAPDTASAAILSINQCNGLAPGSAQELRCSVTIVNNLDVATGLTSSTVITEVCDGPPGEALCVTTPTTSTDIVGSVTQCNASATTGGSTLICRVNIVNNITGVGSTTPATVNQCVGSGTGGGTEPTIDCDPMTSVTGADITQCNTVGNNGGQGGPVLGPRVNCDASGTVSPLWSVPVNQCNGSANGGGSLITCTVEIATNILAPEQDTTTTTAGAGTTVAGAETTTAAGADTTAPVTAPSAPTTIAGQASTTAGFVSDTLSVASTSPLPTFPDVTLPRTGSSAASRSAALIAVLVLLAGVGAMRVARRSAHSRH